MKFAQATYFFLAAALAGCAAETKFGGRSADKVQPRVVLDQEFSAGKVGSDSVRYKPAFGLVEEALTLREKPPVTAQLEQITRQKYSETFTQGDDGAEATEDFDIASAGKLDLLLVVDNSASMEFGQDHLAEKFLSLTSAISDVDWQIGIVTTSSCRLRYGKGFDRVLRKSDFPDDQAAQTAFEQSVRVGTNGSGNERGITNAYKVIMNQCQFDSSSWLRAGAAFAVLFVSDEDSYCKGDNQQNHGGDCQENEDPAVFVNQVRAMNATAKRAYSLTWMAADPTCRTNGDQHDGPRYVQVVRALGGKSESICQPSFEPSLKGISADVASIIRREFTLKDSPVAGSVKLFVKKKGGPDYTPFTAYRIENNHITLTETQDDQVKLRVSYRHDPKPRFERVKLKAKPAAETLLVTINGTAVSPDKITLDQANNEIFFMDMPPDQAVVKAEYRENKVLETVFTLKGLGEAPLSVRVGEKEEASYTFDLASGQLAFAAAPAEGAKIVVTYRPDDYRIVAYPASDSAAAAKAITALDTVTHAPISFALQDGKLVFPAVEIADGRAVAVTYDYGDKETVLSHELPNLPLDGSVSVHVVDGASDCIANVVVNGQSVQFQCNSNVLGEVEITYQFVAEQYSTFTLADDLPADAHLQVFADGKAIHEFQVSGRTVTVPGLDVRAKVRMIATVDE